MPGPVILFVWSRPLVPLDDIPVVLVERKATGEARLLVRAVGDSVKVERRFLLDDEGDLRAQPFQVVGSRLIDGIGIGVSLRGKVDLGSRHMQKAQWIACGQSPRFGRRHDIVGN